MLVILFDDIVIKYFCSWLTNVVFRLKAKRIYKTERRGGVGSSSFPVTSICNIMLCVLASLGCVILYCLHQSTQADLVVLGHFVTLYITFSMADIINILQFYFKQSLPRGCDKFVVCMAFFIQLILETKSKEISKAADFCSIASIAACLISALISTFSIPASSRYIATLSTIMFTSVQGTFVIQLVLMEDNVNSDLIPVFFSLHIMLHFIIQSIILVLVKLDSKKLKTIKSKILDKDKFKLKHKKASKEKLVRRSSLNDTIETEPINFSFYFKDDISDDIKNVMKTIDEMLINETGKTLESISEEPVENEDIPAKETKSENIYVNVNVVNHVLDDSKLEETEVV